MVDPMTSESTAASLPHGLDDELARRLLEQCAIQSVTGAEAELADHLEAHYRTRGEQVLRHGDSLIVGAPEDTRPRVLLVGHLDVVPPTDDDRAPHQEQREGLDVIVGRGASDMKSGNVVAMHLFEDAALREASPFALALVLYAGEEGPAVGNALTAVLQAAPWLTEATLAVVLEPTDGRVELGCLGGLHAHVTFCGTAAHSARPWQGRNALTAAGRFLAALDERDPIDVRVDGIDYRDVLSATQAWTGGPAGQDATTRPVRNVVPDRFTINLNFRFAPSRGLAEAEEELRALVRAHAGTDVPVEVEIVDRVPPAPPHRSSVMVDAFLAATDATVAGKQAWTDVARFAEVGVPALNFGPGATSQAHQRGEWVEVRALTDAATRLRRFLSTPVPVR